MMNNKKRNRRRSPEEINKRRRHTGSGSNVSQDDGCPTSAEPSTSTSDNSRGKNDKQNRARPYILMPDEVEEDNELYLDDQHIDKIMKTLVRVAGRRHRVGYMTVLYSSLVKKYGAEDNVINTKQYIEPSAEEISILLVPIHFSAHYTLAVFDLVKKEAYHFDSLKRKKQNKPYIKIKEALERDFQVEFTEMSREDCFRLINEQLDSFNCGVHICRIAEEIFFNGISRRLSPFVIQEERERIRDIYYAICDPNWNGEWFPQLQNDDRVVDIPSTSADEHAPAANVDVDMTDLSVTDANLTRNDSPNSITSNDEKAVITHEYLGYLIATLPQIGVEVNSVFPTFAQLSVLRNCYQYLERFRKKEYNRTRQNMKPITIFDFDLFEKLKKNELIFVNDLVNGFQAYFDLPVKDKVILFENFYPTFIVFERMFDTVNFMKGICDEKNILLQNGNYFNVQSSEFQRLDGIEDETLAELATSHWITLSFEILLPAFVQLRLHPIEVMYGFGVILFDIQDLNNLSEAALQAKQTCIQRIQADLFQFYGQDREKFKKIKDIDAVVKIAKEVATNYMDVYKRCHKGNGNNGFFTENSSPRSSVIPSISKEAKTNLDM